MDLGHGDLRESDAPDLALGLQLDQRAHLVGKRDLRIDAVQLKQLDALQSEQAEALGGLGLEVLWLAVGSQRPGPGRVNPALVAMTRSPG